MTQKPGADRFALPARDPATDATQHRPPCETFRPCPPAATALERAAVETIAATASAPAMGAREVRVICALTCLLNPTGTVKIGRERIAERAGLSIRSAAGALKTLAEAQVIKRPPARYRATTRTTITAIAQTNAGCEEAPEAQTRWHRARLALHAACVDERIAPRGPRLLAIALATEGSTPRERLLERAQCATRDGARALDGLIGAGYVRERSGRIHQPTADGLDRALDQICPRCIEPAIKSRGGRTGTRRASAPHRGGPSGNGSTNALEGTATADARPQAAQEPSRVYTTQEGATQSASQNAASMTREVSAAARTVAAMTAMLSTTLERRLADAAQTLHVENDMAGENLAELGLGAGDRARIARTLAPLGATKGAAGRRAARAARRIVDAGAGADMLEQFARTAEALAEGRFEEARVSLEALAHAIAAALACAEVEARHARALRRRAASVGRARTTRDERALAEQAKGTTGVAPGCWTATRWRGPGQGAPTDGRQARTILEVRAAHVIDRAEHLDSALPGTPAERITLVLAALAETDRNLQTYRGDTGVGATALRAIATSAAQAKGWA